MFPPKIPKIRNKTSQPLELLLFLALLTIAMVMMPMIKIIMHPTNVPTPRFAPVAASPKLTPAKNNEQRTIPATANKTKIQVKKLAMLYITREAFSIKN